MLSDSDRCGRVSNPPTHAPVVFTTRSRQYELLGLKPNMEGTARETTHFPLTTIYCTGI